MSIATPEGLELDLVLAGVGSRVTAALLDGLVRAALIVALAVVTWIASPSAGFLAAFWFIGLFLVLFVYDPFFEIVAGGRTPGKRWSGLRVVSSSGGAVSIGASVVRNLLRLIDAIPGMYLVGILLILFSSRNQRLGDLVAGTLVVRETRRVAPDLAWIADAVDDEDHETLTWDVSAVTAEEIAAVRKFLERREKLDPEARRRIGRELATRLLPKVVGPTEPTSPEAFLVDLVAAKSRRR